LAKNRHSAKNRRRVPGLHEALVDLYDPGRVWLGASLHRLGILNGPLSGTDRRLLQLKNIRDEPLIYCPRLTKGRFLQFNVAAY